MGFSKILANLSPFMSTQVYFTCESWPKNCWFTLWLCQNSYWKSPFSMGTSTISMAIFNSYVKLPEGTVGLPKKTGPDQDPSSTLRRNCESPHPGRAVIVCQKLFRDVGVSENSLHLNPMFNDHYPVFKWLLLGIYPIFRQTHVVRLHSKHIQKPHLPNLNC